MGAASVSAIQGPGNYLGIWTDLNWLGSDAGAPPIHVTSLSFWLLGPLNYSKFYAVLVLLIVGLSAWFFFRQLKLSPAAGFLGGLAVALNSDFVSTACWGVQPQVIAFAFCFLALAAVVNDHANKRWARTILAGFAVGMVVSEGADIGAIFSLFIAAYVLVHDWVSAEGSPGIRIARGIGRLTLVTACAAVMATQALSGLIGTQIKGIVGTAQDTQTRADRWDPATQWSLPKLETLGLVVHGLFGYKLDTPDGGSYWGRVGRDPSWEYYYNYLASGKLNGGEMLAIAVPGAPNFNTNARVGGDGKISLPSVGQIQVRGKSIEELQQEIARQLSASQPAVKEVSIAIQPPPGFIRYTGGGNYPGVLVILIACWAVCQTLRKQDSPFSPAERKLVWFWSAVVVISLLLAYGRFAPFYQLIYSLPFFSTIRNPTKFLHVFSFAMVILFAYGVHGLNRRYLETVLVDFPGFGARLKNWWSRAAACDRRWLVGCFAAVLVSLVGWLIYLASRQTLERYLETVQLADAATDIARFSIRQAGWFVFFLALAVALVVLVISGALAGKRARWGVFLLGLFLIVDLGVAALPWIIYWNYKEKYATNPVLQRLQEDSYQHRVAALPRWFPYVFQAHDELRRAEQFFNRDLYGIEWAQHHFLYYNIQSLDIIQMPRMPEDMAAFESALQFRFTQDSLHLVTRRWELTNTRYILGTADWLGHLNGALDPARQRFRILERFNVGLKPGKTAFTRLEDLTASPSPNGTYAIFDFTGALPRAKLYSAWEVSTNDQATLNQLASATFDPAQTVLIASAIPAPANAATNAGTVEYVSYAPKRLQLKAQANAPSVLLLNDRYDPQWQVSVDGKPAELLRCNFIMRGVQLPTGSHTIEFVFRPSIRPLYVSLSAIGIGLLMLGYVALPERNQAGGKAGKNPAAASSPS